MLLDIKFMSVGCGYTINSFLSTAERLDFLFSSHFLVPDFLIFISGWLVVNLWKLVFLWNFQIGKSGLGDFYHFLCKFGNLTNLCDWWTKLGARCLVPGAWCQQQIPCIWNRNIKIIFESKIKSSTIFGDSLDPLSHPSYWWRDERQINGSSDSLT